MAISVYISNSGDQGTQSSSNIGLGGPLPDGCAVWVAIARADAHSTGAVSTVTDDASPSSNVYNFVQYVDNGGSEPEIELWVADNITGGPTTVFWSAGSSVDTSIAVVVFQGQATPSVEDFGTGAAQPSDGGTDFLSDTASTSDPNDNIVLVAGVDAQGNSIGWGGLTVAPNAFTSGSGDSAIAFALGVAGATGPQNAEITGDSSAPGPTWVYFAAAVAVGGAPPPLSATASAVPISGPAPLAVAFTGGASGGTGPYTYAWDFGDGGTSTDQSPNYTYLTPGNYTAQLVVTDSTAATANAPPLSITVGAPVISVSVSGTPLAGTAPLSVSFTASASGGTGPYTYAWVFGDGGTSALQNPSHTYAAPGGYVASCTATDSMADTGTSPDVDVTALPPVPDPHPQVVQSVKAGQSSGGPQFLTLPPMTVTAGNAVYVFINRVGGPFPASFNITDGLGNLYVLQTGYEYESGTTVGVVLVFAAYDVVGGSVAVEISATSGIGQVQAFAAEISDADVGLDIAVPGNNTVSVSTPSGTNLDLLLMLFQDPTSSAESLSATLPNVLLQSVFTSSGGGIAANAALVEQPVGLSGSSPYTVAIDGAALGGGVVIGVPPVPPAHALSPGASVQANGSSTATVTLPPITVAEGSALCVVAGWPRNSGAGINVASITGGPAFTKRQGAGGGPAGDGIVVLTADAVTAGTYTLVVTITTPVAELWAAAVEVASTYSGGAGYDSVGSGTIGAAGTAEFQKDLYAAYDASPSASSVDDCYLLAVATQSLSPAGILPSAVGSLGGATSVGTRAVMASPALSPTGFAVLTSTPYQTGSAGDLYAGMFNGGAVATAIAVAFKPIGTPDPIAVTAVAVPGSGTAPLPVQLESTVLGGQPPYSFYWTFGDGGTSNEQNPSHTYSNPGAYTATVLVVDAADDLGSASTGVSVAAPIGRTQRWCHPYYTPFRIPPFHVRDFALTDVQFLSHATPIRDTSAHDYTTDGCTDFVEGTMWLQMLSVEAPPVAAYALWCDNGLDQDVTVQPIGNVVYDQTQPDFDLGASFPVTSGDRSWSFNRFDAVPVEFLAVRVAAGTKPTTGSFDAVLCVYQRAQR